MRRRVEDSSLVVQGFTDFSLVDSTLRRGTNERGSAARDRCRKAFWNNSTFAAGYPVLPDFPR